jgi:hypothetical protein
MAPSSSLASPEPMTRGTVLHSSIEACRELWGEDGLRDALRRLPAEVREATTGADFTALRFYPTRYVNAWDEAKMAGPARGDEDEFRRSVARGMELGFGRVRRVFLSFATPMLLAQRAAELWRHDHTHGEVSVDSSMRDQGRARVTLVGHPFVETPLARLAFGEVVRHLLSMSRARNVRETHAHSGDSLVVALSWDT